MTYIIQKYKNERRRPFLLKKYMNSFSFFCKLKDLKKDEFNLLQAQKLKNMVLIFCCLKKLKKHEFDFLQAQKKWIYFFFWLKKLKKHGMKFMRAKRSPQKME